MVYSFHESGIHYILLLPWIAYQLTGSAVIMSSLFAVNVLPIVLFGPLVGVLVVDMIEKVTLDGGYYQYYFSKSRTNSTCITSIRSLAFIRNYFYLSSYVHAFDVTTVTVIPHIADASLTKANSLYQMVNQLASLFELRDKLGFHIFYWRLSSTLD